MSRTFEGIGLRLLIKHVLLQFKAADVRPWLYEGRSVRRKW
jgi:hypothetical protein